MITFLILIIAIPSLSLFLKTCFEPSMIFRRFHLYMIYWWIKTWRKEDRWKRWFIKPFICIYCYNTWLSIISYFLFLSTNFLFLPLFIGLTYVMLEILMNIIKH